jgi:DNA polymerase III epsilon subunit-like protein
MRFLFIDIETTGLQVADNEILTLAAIKTDKNLNELDSKLFKFRPEVWKPHYFDAVRIHGINMEQSSQYPIKAKAMEDFLCWLEDPHYFICHSKKENFGKEFSFDYAFMEMQCLDTSTLFMFRQLLGTKSLSTHKIAQTFYSNHKVGFNYEKGRPKLGLSHLCNYFGIELEHHNAESDVRACLEIARRLRDIDEKFFYRCIEGYLDLWEAISE